MKAARLRKLSRKLGLGVSITAVEPVENETYELLEPILASSHIDTRHKSLQRANGPESLPPLRHNIAPKWPIIKYMHAIQLACALTKSCLTFVND